MRLRKFALVGILSVLVLLGLAPVPAGAITYTGADQGVTITLVDTLAIGTVHDLVLTMDTGGYNTVASAFLHGISLKTLNAVLASEITVVSVPALAALRGGQVNALSTSPNGNQVGNGSGFFTELFDGLTGPGVPDGTLTFHWLVDYGIHNLAGPEFKAIYVDSIGNKVNGITSITLNGAVPEPGTLALLGSGLTGLLGVWGWRRKESEGTNAS